MPDFSGFSDDKMIRTAGTFGWVLSDVFNRSVYDRHIHIHAVSSTGQRLTYSGPHDYRDPWLRAVVTSVVPPLAQQLLFAARGRSCEASVRYRLGEPVISMLKSGAFYEVPPREVPRTKELIFTFAQCRLRYPL